MYSLLKIIIIFIILVKSVELYSQCGCSSVGSLSGGSGFNYIESIGVLAQYIFETNLRFSHTYASQFYFNDEKVGFGDEEIVNFSMLNFYSAYGFNDYFTLETDVGHFYYNSKNLCDTLSNNSFTSWNTIAKFNVLKKANAGLDLTIGAGTKVPLSNKRIESLGYSMPVSSGYGMIFKLIADVSLIDDNLHILSFNNFDLNIIDSRDYVFGNILTSSIYFGTSLFRNSSTFFEFRQIYRTKDMNENEYVKNTGAYYLVLSAIQNFKLDSWHFGFAIELPIYRKVIGTQLTNDFTLSLNFGKSFDFRPYDPIYEEYLKFKDDFESYDDFKRQFGL